MRDNKLIQLAIENKRKNSRKLYDPSDKVRLASKSTQQFEENRTKGTQFEKFIVSQFDDEYFHLIEWRGDKNIGGIRALMDQYPDLVFYFQSNTQESYFAVECKWKEYFYHEVFNLEQNHLDNYRYYAEVTGYPVFLIIGIGNTPSSPNHVFVVPLSEIIKPDLHEFELNVFKRPDPKRAFRLHCGSKTLK
jgi:hypothetical protein